MILKVSGRTFLEIKTLLIELGEIRGNLFYDDGIDMQDIIIQKIETPEIEDVPLG